jgi:hypothetical protein
VRALAGFDPDRPATSHNKSVAVCLIDSVLLDISRKPMDSPIPFLKFQYSSLLSITSPWILGYLLFGFGLSGLRIIT